MIRSLSILVSVVTFILVLTISSGYAFQDHILAAWLMEERSGKVIKDFAGNFEDGEIFGETEWVAGKFGKALKFDGETVYVRVPFNKKFQMLNVGDFSFAGWFMADVLPADRGIGWSGVLQQMDLNGTGRTWMAVHSTKENGGAFTYLGSGNTWGTPPVAKQWYHFAVVIEEKGDVDNIQFYSNGEPQAPNTRKMDTCEGDFLIGSAKTPGVNLWQGLIDEMVIFDKALTQDDVKQLMDNGVQNRTAVESRNSLATTWGVIKSSL